MRHPASTGLCRAAALGRPKQGSAMGHAEARSRPWEARPLYSAVGVLS